MDGINQIGAFRGRKLSQTKGTIGGARSVFVKIQGVKNQLVYPTFGGPIKTTFKTGNGKFFAGDLCYYKTDDNGYNPEIYILKTFKVASEVSNATTIEIENDGYRHKPCVGDKIGKAPAKIGGSITTTLTVTDVKTADGKWIVTVDQNATLSKNDILVESDGSKMLVTNINAVIDSDLDMNDIPSTGDDDFEGARYFYTPALGGIMYIHKMSPMPKCVLDLNQSNVNGWFRIQTV